MITCLLVGSILAVAIISSIPMYRDGILQRMLIKDLEIFQTDNNESPAVYTLDFSPMGKYDIGDERINAYYWFKNKSLPYQRRSRAEKTPNISPTKPFVG